MPKDTSIKKVMVIGSGPIVIGQAAEFDYAGTQACKVLREEGLEVVLANSNPATIMTDANIADKVYMEPLTVEVLSEILRKERPDSILPNLGGQTGLNLAMELAESGILEELNIRLLGTRAESIRASEDRDEFKKTMERIGEPVTESIIAHTVEECMAFGEREGYPLIVRPAYTLGGTGGGIAETPEQLREIATDGLRASRVHQVLLEKSLMGWKEIEYETIRDNSGNSIIVCNMENIDPVGVHTGDSIVVAPTQTLRDKEHQMLRTAALNIVESLGIRGGCNVQFALDPQSMQYYVIEVNPRVSRSSALASKATGYPIAKVTTKIALGYNLDEIRNDVTGTTFACLEPTIDYVVVKVPRWPFDKFVSADRNIGTRMKATGEVMAIGNNFEAALMKAVRSLELKIWSMEGKKGEVHSDSDEVVQSDLYKINTERLFAVARALRHGTSIERINEITKIDPWFLTKIAHIVALEEEVKKVGKDGLTPALVKQIKQYGLADKWIAETVGMPEPEFRQLRKSMGVTAAFRLVDTCGAEFDAVSPYYYSCYGVENEAEKQAGKSAVVLGSGPIRIGQGVEFDYCSVHCTWALKKAGFSTIIVNNNPETVSTDFDTSDKLYFEPLTAEEVWNVLEQELPEGVVVQVGGQTAISLAQSVEQAGYPIIGTTADDIDAAEDRKSFDKLMNDLQIPRPQGDTVFSVEEAIEVAGRLGYPLLVRPSYVLGGMGMEIVHDDAGMRRSMEIINPDRNGHPVLIDKYLMGREMEVDAVSDGTDILIPGIMEHIERAGIHSGDSISVYPAHVSDKIGAKVIDYTRKLAAGLHVKGLLNIQFIEYQDELYVIEVNPRSSRTVPYISKVVGLPVVELAVRASLGEKIKDMGYGTGLYRENKIVAVKMPVFSFEKLPGVEVSLGPEMKSTGEVLGMGHTLRQALSKAFLAASGRVSPGGALVTVANADKPAARAIIQGLMVLGFTIYSTKGTAAYLRESGIEVTEIPKLHEADKMAELIKNGEIKVIVCTPTRGHREDSDGFRLRRLAVECGIPCMTSIDTAMAFIKAMASDPSEVIELHDVQA